MPDNRLKIFVQTASDRLEYLGRELSALGYDAELVDSVGYNLNAGMLDVIRLNMTLRTAQRVLIEIAKFRADDPGMLYAELLKIPWESYIPIDGYVCVTSSAHNIHIKDTSYASRKAKDAIVDRIRNKTGVRPQSGPLRDKTVVHLYWHERDAVIYLDTSGEPLGRRGYRLKGLEAPMEETLAASVVMASGWPDESIVNFINPMCGSGTIAIEAAMAAHNIAPGLSRRNYGFMHISGFDRVEYEKLRVELEKAAQIKKSKSKIIATDIDSIAIKTSKENASRAGVLDHIDFRTCDFADTPLPDGGGVVVMNPPYGERMGEENELSGLYKRIGDYFKQTCGPMGYTGYIFTCNLNLAKRIGLRTGRRMIFKSGPLDCRLLKYELYEGSRKGITLSI